MAIDVAGSFRSTRVIEVLTRLITVRGAPRYRRSDNGPEFVSTALLKRVLEQGIETLLIEPGKPWQNGTNESFKGKFRDECLAMEWFGNRLEAKVASEDLRGYYDGLRPHSNLKNQTPAAFSKQLETCSPTGAIPSQAEAGSKKSGQVSVGNANRSDLEDGDSFGTTSGSKKRAADDCYANHWFEYHRFKSW